MSVFGVNLLCVIHFSGGLMRNWVADGKGQCQGRGLGVGWGICSVWVLPSVSFLWDPIASTARWQSFLM